jgi:UDP-N-acetylglucosamine 2-epimerase (non-hydrolysing)/GDP/UDP-N,N'-diacetylbacillosamine 2-epimerase (hydrolysing)
LEAPSFKLPVINIGSRQHGRLRANNVIDVPVHDTLSIAKALDIAMNNEPFQTEAKKCYNPYGDGHASERTVSILEGLDLNQPHLVAKWLDTGKDYLDFARNLALNYK